MAQLALEKQHLMAFPAEARPRVAKDTRRGCLRLRSAFAHARPPGSGRTRCRGVAVGARRGADGAAQEASELASYLHSHLGVSEATAAAVIRDIQSSENSDTKMLELHAKCVCQSAARCAPMRTRDALASLLWNAA